MGDTSQALKHIRVATEDEIAAITDRSDILPGRTQVLALEDGKGDVDIAVVRNCIEVNPVIYAKGTNDLRRVRFLYSLEERLLGSGIDRYYFQLDAANEHYIKVAENFGAQRVSPHAEIRMLKVIR